MVTAITLDLLLLAGLGLYSRWAMSAYAHRTAWWLIALALPAAYIAVFVLVTLSWFALAWIWGVRRPPEVHLGLRGSLRLFWNELLALLGSGTRMGILWWWMREPAPAPATSPVLLLHGVLCNAGVWTRMLASLKAAGIGPVYTLSYGPPLASIEHFADQTAEKIERIRTETGAARVAIVAHSMGGLVARAYVRRYGARAVDRVITIGTPHRGSVHAWLFPGTSLSQLRAGNPWLVALNAAPVPPVRIVSIWSWHDSMVAPQDSAALPEAENIAIAACAHNALLREPEVAKLVIAELRRAQDAASRSLGSPATSESPA